MNLFPFQMMENLKLNVIQDRRANNLSAKVWAKYFGRQRKVLFRIRKYIKCYYLSPPCISWREWFFYHLSYGRLGFKTNCSWFVVPIVWLSMTHTLSFNFGINLTQSSCLIARDSCWKHFQQELSLKAI